MSVGHTTSLTRQLAKWLVEVPETGDLFTPNHLYRNNYINV